MAGKIIAIGDIHGELAKLKTLFKKLTFDKDDTLVFLGDYIDRGPDSKGVIDYIQKLKEEYNVVTIKGNHEDMAEMTYKSFFSSHAWESTSGNQPFNVWMNNGGVKCLESYNKADTNCALYAAVVQEMFSVHSKFFRDLEITYETENHIFVHGGLCNLTDASEQNAFFCFWGRYSDIEPHISGKTVVCGHTIQRDGPRDDGHKVCIDTGSFLSDGYITAMEIDGPKTRFITSK